MHKIQLTADTLAAVIRHGSRRILDFGPSALFAAA
jgi:hypothetical protein